MFLFFLISIAFLYLIFSNYDQKVNKSEHLGLEEVLETKRLAQCHNTSSGEEQGLEPVPCLFLPGLVTLAMLPSHHNSWGNLCWSYGVISESNQVTPLR